LATKKSHHGLEKDDFAKNVEPDMSESYTFPTPIKLEQNIALSRD